MAYGKMRWFGSDISRFDFYLAAGAGITDDGTGRGLTGSGGFGMKIYIGQWFGLRLDVRDHVLSQENPRREPDCERYRDHRRFQRVPPVFGLAPWGVGREPSLPCRGSWSKWRWC